jgi:ABC-2 type transport system permease protein
MMSALRAEWRRFLCTRSLLAVPAIGLLIAVLGAVLLLSAGKPEEVGSSLSGYGPLRFGPTSFGLLLMVLGVRMFSDETHHRTLSATLLRTPKRARVMAAKAVVAVLTAIVFCLVVYVLVIPITAAGVELRQLDFAYDSGDTAALLLRVVVAMALLTALGVAVGVLLRSRTVALVAVVLWFALAEDLVAALLKGDRLLPGAAAQSLVSAGSGSSTSATSAALVLAGIVASTFVVAVVSLRRDIR